MVTGGAEVIVGALGTFPADADDGLLPAGVTHGAVMLDTYNKETQDRRSRLSFVWKESPMSAVFAYLHSKER